MCETCGCKTKPDEGEKQDDNKEERQDKSAN
jgi:hypothetical protein